MKGKKYKGITIKNSHSSVSVLPERGAIVYSLILNGVEILFQDMLEHTLYDENVNVRGGIPILFPQAGPMSDKEEEILGYSLPQHGIARTNKWKVLEQGGEYLTLYFNEKMQEGEHKFPYEFELFLNYVLKESEFKITFTIKNTDTKEFVCSPGFHPYFSVPDDKKDSIFWEKSLEDRIKNESEVWKNDGTLHLDLPANNMHFGIENLGNIGFKYSKELRRFWIWSMKDKNFVCVEPVCGDEGNLLKNPLSLGAGESVEIFFKICLEK